MGSLVSLCPDAVSSSTGTKERESGLPKILSKGSVFYDNEKRIQSQASDGG